MDVHGYLCEVEYDGETLRARGTNKAAHVALRGQDRDKGDLVLSRDEITAVEMKEASRLVNGRLVLHAADGQKYQLHFRRKQAGDFAALHQALAG